MKSIFHLPQVRRKGLFAQTFDKVHQLAVGLPPLIILAIRL